MGIFSFLKEKVKPQRRSARGALGAMGKKSGCS
jgi:hypothetical protein